MKKIVQEVKGNNNIQIAGENNSVIYTTRGVTVKNEIKPEQGVHITDEQAHFISEKVKEIVSMLSSDGSSTKLHFQNEWGALKRKFKITSYKLLPISQYDDAMKFLQKRIASFGKAKLKRTNPEKWAIKQYGAIYTRSRELGLDKNDVLEFATRYLQLKTPITSLKELKKNDLEKLYNKIFSM